MSPGKPRVVFVSDRSDGGAALPLRRMLRTGILQEHLTCRWLAGMGSASPEVELIAQGSPLALRLLCRAVARGPSGKRMVGRIERNYRGERLRRALCAESPDILHLHNMHDAFVPNFSALIPRDIRVVWTLHDMWPLTGYCGYSYECNKYLEQCVGDCPQAGYWGDMTFGNAALGWSVRDSVFRALRDRVVVVTPSRWLARVVMLRLGVTAQVLPYGLDTNLFRPQAPKRTCRAILDLPEDGPLVLAGADWLTDRRKGIDRVVAAMRSVRSSFPDAHLVVFGSGAAPGAGESWVRTPGRITDERLLALHYCAADVFVHPALADNLPNTIIEAMACGTPCVAYSVGGVPELIHDGKTGLLARETTVPGLAETLRHALGLSVGDQRMMSDNAREAVVRTYSATLMAERHLRMYECVLGGKVLSGV